MKQHRIPSMALAALACMALLVPLAGGRQDRQQEILLQKAIQKETVDGELNTAITMYRQILANPGENRTIAAKALLQIGKCYEKLGSAEAPKAYEQLLSEYPDQREITTEARTRLAALARPADDSGITMRQVWVGSDANNAGTPSPDGRFLSYIDWNSGGNVAIRELASGQTRLITTSANGPEHFALNPIMSPDGKQVAYQWQNEELQYDLRVVGIDGSNARIVYSEKNCDIYPRCWSPDGREIAVLRMFGYRPGRDDYEKTDLALANVADGTIRIPKIAENPRKVLYSPDGSCLIYHFPVAGDSGNFDISLAPMDGGAEIPLIRNPADDRLLGWIPGTEDLIFRSNRSGTWDLFMLHIRDRKPQGAAEPIKRAIGAISPIGFAGDGSFFFSTYTRSATLRVTPFAATTGKIEVEEGEAFLGSNMLPSWSPDGQYLAFATEKPPAGSGLPFRRLRIRNMKTGDIRESASHLEINSLYRWSPDARAILVRGNPQNRQGKYGIYEVGIPDGKASLLLELAEGGNIADAVWIRDRKEILYIKGGSIVLRDLQTNRERELYKQSGENPRYLCASPDGKYLAVITQGSDNSPGRLLMISISNGVTRELAKLKDQQFTFGGFGWTPDGKSLLYQLAEGRDAYSLNRIDAEGGSPEKLWESKDLISGMSIHPDGKRMALSNLTQVTEIWAMENLRQLVK